MANIRQNFGIVVLSIVSRSVGVTFDRKIKRSDLIVVIDRPWSRVLAKFLYSLRTRQQSCEVLLRLSYVIGSV